jgi:Retrotransposon gag protein
LAINGTARSWSSVLPPGSIYSWEQLRSALYSNFHGNWADKITATDLFVLKKQPTETLQSYMHCFVHIRCQAKGLSKDTIIDAAIQDIIGGLLAGKLTRKRP